VGERFAASPLASEKAGALYVGRIMPHKGIDRLIRAAPPGLQITIAGKTYDSDYEKHLHQLASGKAVRFVDNPDDDELASLYARAAIHVAPSVVRDYLGKFHPNAELMGLTTLESLASGTAVAVADTCSLPELIAGGNVGECFSSEAELAGILSRVLDGSWVDQYPSARCRAFALDSYAPDVVGRAIADIYDDALQARGLE
jgi:glycosyltransferase involved in cell wall biosynthesis